MEIPWRLLHPHLLLEKIQSPFNGSIQVYSEFGQPRIIVDGMPQSGGIVTDILKKSLSHFNKPQNFLLLGLGGGDILHHIHRRWPDCHLTAVEIDPAMINIAKKYFKIDQIPNLKIVNADAYHFVTSPLPSPTRRGNSPSYFKRGLGGVNQDATFDAILVDCYLGRQIPEKLEGLNFLRNLKILLTPSGVIAFNRLYDQKRVETQKFLNKLNQVFPSVTTHKAYCNILIIATK